MDMTPNFQKMGARFLGPQDYNSADLGPLAGLIGEWHGLAPATPDLVSNGWNVMSVPGGPGIDFVFEVIPYQEVLKFSPVIIQAGNRGPVVGGAQVNQLIYGLMYEQEITSVCTTDFCKQRGFSSGTPIHAETGLFLNIGQPNGGYTIARLSTIPHGNSVLALGTSNQSSNPGTNFFPVASAMPTNLDGSGLSSSEFGFGYSDVITGPPQFPVFEQNDPNLFLQKSLKQITGSGSIPQMTTLDFTTTTPNANGGILNIPFINSNVDAHSMTAIFWIENIEGGTESQLLQYTQTINLVFPPTGKPFPVVWPHITINTLIKVNEKTNLLKDA